MRGTKLLPGRLPWGTTALPTGEVLAPCEDQSLTVFDGWAAEIARWQAPSRFAAPVTVGPRSPLQLLAAPLVSGRVEVLVWDPRSRVLALHFGVDHPAEATASAWSSGGILHLGWKDGEVQAWSPSGELQWTASTGVALRFLLVDDALGVYALGPGRVVLLDPRGREIGAWALEGTPRGLLQSLGGDLYVWNESGLWKKPSEGAAFLRFDPSPSLLGVVVDRQERLILTEPTRIRRLDPSARLLAEIRLADEAVTGSALDDRGRVLVGTRAGLQVWTYDGRLLATLDKAAPSAPLQMSDQGRGSWGSTDWRFHLWAGFQKPAFGWSQDGGGAGRPYSARRPSSIAVRSVNWTEDADFGSFFQLVASGEEAKQRSVLERFEAANASGALLDTWPFANLILLKIARSGLTDLIMRDRNRVSNSWPGLRLRAYQLLSRTASPEDREEMIALLQREYDPSVAAQGALALAQSGWDGDGKILRLLADLQSRMIDQTVVADAVIDAARTLWLANGRSADPVLVPLVSAVFQGTYPRGVKLKAQKFFQDLMEAP